MEQKIKRTKGIMRCLILLIVSFILSGCVSGYEIKESIKSKFPNTEIYQIEPGNKSRYLMIDSLGSIYLVKVNCLLDKSHISSVTKIK